MQDIFIFYFLFSWAFSIVTMPMFIGICLYKLYVHFSQKETKSIAGEQNDRQKKEKES